MEENQQSSRYGTKNRLVSSGSFCASSTKEWNSDDIFKEEIFDAERFLEDLGFAGSVDPGIPERFLPSLLVRLATMPRTALWYLNHRILQALLLHKRKETRRRLFRYSSVNNKEVLESRSQILSLLNHHAADVGTKKGLVRALTGPADYSQETVLSACQSARRYLTIPSLEKEPKTRIPNFDVDSPVSIYVNVPTDNKPCNSIQNSEDLTTQETSEIKITEINNESKSSEDTLRKETCLECPDLLKKTNAFQNERITSLDKSPIERKRMALQRCPAVTRPRSASEPSSVQCKIDFELFCENERESNNNSDNKTFPNRRKFELQLPICSKSHEYDTISNDIPRLWFKENHIFTDLSTYVNLWSKDPGLQQVTDMCTKNERPFFTRQCRINADLFFPESSTKRNFNYIIPPNFKRLFINKQYLQSVKNPKHIMCNPLTTFLPDVNILEYSKTIIDILKSNHLTSHKFMQEFNSSKAIRCADRQLDDSRCANMNNSEISLTAALAYLHSVLASSNSRHRHIYCGSRNLEYLLLFINRLIDESAGDIWNNRSDMTFSYLSNNQSKRDNRSLPYAHNETLSDNCQVIEKNVASTITDFTSEMSIEVNNNLCENINKPLFVSGLSFDIDQSGTSNPNYQSAICLQIGEANLPAPIIIPENSNETVENHGRKDFGSPENKRSPAHNFFRKATQEIIELREYIQKAKVNRESASTELQHLQGILQAPSNLDSKPVISSECCFRETETNHEHLEGGKEENDEELFTKVKQKAIELQGATGRQVNETPVVDFRLHEEVKDSDGTSSENGNRQKQLNVRRLRKNLLRVEQRHFEDISRVEKELQAVRDEFTEDKRRYWDKVDALQWMVSQLQRDTFRFQQALAELQKKVKVKGDSESLHEEKDVRIRIQQELEKEWSSRISVMEDKLQTAEKQLSILQEENEQLRRQLLLSSIHNSDPIQPVNESRKTVPVMNGLTTSIHIDEKKISEKKLRDELRETEERADRLNLMLDEKLVELNRVQLALSKRTKEMVLLEKAYLQLRYQLRRTCRPLKAANPAPTLPLSNGTSADDPP